MNHSPVQPRFPLSAFGPDPGGTSRRQQPRNALRCPVKIAMPGGAERNGITVDLSHDGLSLSTDRPIPPGSRCMLRLQPPAAPDAGPLDVQVKAVYSSYTAPGDFRIGMVFIGLDPRTEDTLRALSVTT